MAMVEPNCSDGARIREHFLRRLETRHGHLSYICVTHSSLSSALVHRPADQAGLAGAGNFHSGTCGGKTSEAWAPARLVSPEFQVLQVPLHGSRRGSLLARSLHQGGIRVLNHGAELVELEIL